MTISAPLGDSGIKVATACIDGHMWIFSGEKMIALSPDEIKDLFYFMREKFDSENERLTDG